VSASPTPSASPLVAMGDPQAPFSRVVAILHRHGLVDTRSATPRLAAGARLLSIGDHFDWGGRSHVERAAVAHDGEQCLRFLARHHADQVIILAGNHDLARVGELLHVDDATFASLQEAADRHYYDDASVAHAGAYFKQCGFLPSTEIAARDLSTFRVSQRKLVLSLLRHRRLRLAHAENGLLFTHAGVTLKALWHLGLDEGANVEAIADALNGALDIAVDHCLGARLKRPLTIPGLHRPGDGIGEGDGILYHRPTFVEDDQWLEPRRFDPRRLPRGLWQVVGHVRDSRCVKALKGWSEVAMPENGVLRHLTVVDGVVRYRHGPPPPRAALPADAAVMIFIDGGMSATDVDRYQLFDAARVDAARTA
jgi:hypothetical protein